MDSTNCSRFPKYCRGFHKSAYFWSNFERYNDLRICLWNPKQHRRLKKSSNVADSAKNLILTCCGFRLQCRECTVWPSNDSNQKLRFSAPTSKLVFIGTKSSFGKFLGNLNKKRYLKIVQMGTLWVGRGSNLWKGGHPPFPLPKFAGVQVFKRVEILSERSKKMKEHSLAYNVWLDSSLTWVFFFWQFQYRLTWWFSHQQKFVVFVFKMELKNKAKQKQLIWKKNAVHAISYNGKRGYHWFHSKEEIYHDISIQFLNLWYCMIIVFSIAMNCLLSIFW